MESGLPASASRWQAGQTLLIVLMVMVVALTVGLSVAIRSTANIRISSEDESSQRAFSAAEAGIERTLANPTPIADTSLGNNSHYSTLVKPLSGTEIVLHNGAIILKDEPIDVWLSNHPDFTGQWSGNLTVNWGTAGEVCNTGPESSTTQAALEIILISGSKAAPKLTEYLLDPCSARAAVNKFQTTTSPLPLRVLTPGDTFGGKTFGYKYTIAVTSGLLMRIIPLYAPTIAGVKAPADLPAQGTVITATGISDTTQRKIVSFRGYPKLPVELFPFIFFSPK